MTKTLTDEQTIALVHSTLGTMTTRSPEAREAAKHALTMALVTMGFDHNWLCDRYARILNAMFDLASEIKVDWRSIEGVNLYCACDKLGSNAKVTRVDDGYRWSIHDKNGELAFGGETQTLPEALAAAERCLQLVDREDPTVTPDRGYWPILMRNECVESDMSVFKGLGGVDAIDTLLGVEEAGPSVGVDASVAEEETSSPTLDEQCKNSQDWKINLIVCNTCLFE